VSTSSLLVCRIYFMLFYFIAAVRTWATKYSAITVQRKYVGGDMLICRGNRQFGLRNRRNVYMCTSAWQFAENLKMSDVSDVAAAAASVVLTVDITIILQYVGWRKGDRCYVVGQRSARATCSCPNCEQQTHGCIKFHKCRQLAEFDFCCVWSESR